MHRKIISSVNLYFVIDTEPLLYLDMSVKTPFSPVANPEYYYPDLMPTTADESQSGSAKIAGRPNNS